MLYGVIVIGDNYLRYKNYELLKNEFKSIKWEAIISKKSIIREKIKEIEIHKNFKNPKIPDEFLEQILRNVGC